jgi:hypothetical protein
MPGVRHLLPVTALAIAVLAASFAPSAAGESGDDVSLAIQLAAHHQPTADTSTGPSFEVAYIINPEVGLSQTVTLTVGLPDGLRWGADPPDPGEGCRGTAPAVCTVALQPDALGNVGGGYIWDVVADRPGTYELTATLETTLPDPDTSNNTATFRVDVVQSSSGSGGAGTTLPVTATAAKVGPKQPRAGSKVTASVHVARGGASVRPTRITCAGTIGKTRLKGTGKATRGSATCRYSTPRGAKGKILRGAISFTAGSRKITKRFAVRLR